MDIQHMIDESVYGVEKIIHNVGKINEATASVSTVVEEQYATVGEMERNASRTSSQTQQVSEDIIAVCQDAHQAGEVSKVVLDAASELARFHGASIRRVHAVRVSRRNPGCRAAGCGAR